MNYPIVLTKDDLDIIAAGLGELQFKLAAPVFGRIQQQMKAFDEQAKEPQLDAGDGN